MKARKFRVTDICTAYNTEILTYIRMTIARIAYLS